MFAGGVVALRVVSPSDIRTMLARQRGDDALTLRSSMKVGAGVD
jgi:hypothetical protein